MRPLAFSILFALLAHASAADQTARTGSKTIKGWLSDEQCARGRASSGAFTGPIPDARKIASQRAGKLY